MKRTEIAELFRLDPKEDFPVQVAGWVKTSRESKNLAFIEINDGSCFKNLQVIIEANKFS